MPDMSRIKWYALLAIGVAFTAGGVAMIVTGAENGWFVFSFFGLCTAIFVGQLWPGFFLRKPEAPGTLLRRFPGPVELRADRLKYFYLLIGAAIFGGLTFWLLQRERFGWFETVMLWLCVLFCAAAIPLMIVLMFRESTLRLDAEGLRVAHGWRNQLTRWADTSLFEVASVPIPSGEAPLVVYDDATSRNSTLRALNTSIVGRNAALPDTYGLSHEDLAWLLNEWRERALAEGPRRFTP